MGGRCSAEYAGWNKQPACPATTSTSPSALPQGSHTLNRYVYTVLLLNLMWGFLFPLSSNFLSISTLPHRFISVWFWDRIGLFDLGGLGGTFLYPKPSHSSSPLLHLPAHHPCLHPHMPVAPPAHPYLLPALSSCTPPACHHASSSPTEERNGGWGVAGCVAGRLWGRRRRRGRDQRKERKGFLAGLASPENAAGSRNGGSVTA